MPPVATAKARHLTLAIAYPASFEPATVITSFPCVFAQAHWAYAVIRTVELVVLRGAIYWRIKGSLPINSSFLPLPCHLIYCKLRTLPSYHPSNLDHLRLLIDRSFDFSFSLVPLENPLPSSSSWLSPEPGRLDTRDSSTSDLSVSISLELLPCLSSH